MMRSSSWLFFVAAAAAQSIQDYENFNTCFFELLDKNYIRAAYNLSYFHLRTDEFKVYDSQPNTFVYLFNFCGTIPSEDYYDTKTVPQSCYNAPGPCSDIQNGQCAKYYNVSGQLPVALQLAALDSYENAPLAKCHWLGALIPSKSNYNVSLLDHSDAGRGVVYEYMNGEWCASAGINRKLRVELKCPDSNRKYFNPALETDIFETVVEDPDCVYTITYTSPLACPDNCISSYSDGMKSVCSGRGVCASDPIARETRCLCDEGWAGNKCNEAHTDTEEINEDHTGIVSAIVICLVLLALILGLSAWLCYRIRLKEEEQRAQLGEFFSPMLANQKADTATNAEGVSMGQVNPSTAPDTTSKDNGDDTAQDTTDAAVSIN